MTVQPEGRNIHGNGQTVCRFSVIASSTKHVEAKGVNRFFPFSSPPSSSPTPAFSPRYPACRTLGYHLSLNSPGDVLRVSFNRRGLSATARKLCYSCASDMTPKTVLPFSFRSIRNSTSCPTSHRNRRSHCVSYLLMLVLLSLHRLPPVHLAGPALQSWLPALPAIGFLPCRGSLRIIGFLHCVGSLFHVGFLTANGSNNHATLPCLWPSFSS